MAVPTSFLSELVALFGSPVAENPTQWMHEKAFAACGLNWRYITMEVREENLADAVRGLRAMQFAGANCTLPHKIEVMAHLDDITETAQKIGAVNTIVRQKNGTLLGENTDGKGFLRAVREVGFTIPGTKAVILGAGGAARAVGVELALAGAAEVIVVNRTHERAALLARQITERTTARAVPASWYETYRVPRETQIVINATSVGLAPNNSEVVPLDYGTISAEMLVCDVIPNPPDTPFLQNARAAGAATLDGLGMLVYQGAIAFRLWTGQDAPIPVMRAALEEIFNG